MIPRPIQQLLLATFYDVFSQWADTFTFACRKGCATCCTRSVTMTSLEGDRIMAFLAEADRRSELAAPAFQPATTRIKQCTTNAFVSAHLRGEAVDEEAENWDLRPCPFLKDESCSIYPARPFGCRLFASLDPCAASGVAEMPPGYLAGATALLQYIEHLDNGGRWGTMVELLAGLNTGQAENYGEPTAPIPGFLIAPDELALVEPLLQGLLAREINGQTFEQWLQASRS